MESISMAFPLLWQILLNLLDYPCNFWEQAFGNKLNSGVFSTTLTKQLRYGRWSQFAQDYRTKLSFLSFPLWHCFHPLPLISQNFCEVISIWPSYVIANELIKSYRKKIRIACDFYLTLNWVFNYLQALYEILWLNNFAVLFSNVIWK